MTQHDHSTVVGVFDDNERARDAIEALKDSGFAAQDIGILMKDKGDAKDMAEETGTHAGEGAATGLIGGGILGGLAGWLVGIGALAIPGVGPFIAAGAFGTALAGAGIGAGIGAIAGALVGMGIPKEEAEFYEGEVRSGRTLVTVNARNRYSEARNILRQFGAYDVHDRTGADADTMTAGTTTGGRMVSTDTGTYGSSTMGSRRWEDVMPEYRSRWQQRYGTMGSGYRWEDYEPGYHYAYDMYNRPEYQNRSWNEVEPEFRRDWQNRYHDKPWDRFGESIHDAWDNLTHHDRDFGRETTTRGTMTGERMTDQNRTMELREEELRGRKEREQIGEVGARKEVVSEEKSIDVPVSHEEVFIERHPVDRPSDRPIGTDEGEDIRMRVHDEHVVPEKETFVREEVNLGKRQTQDTERVSDTVRREELKVDKEGDFEIVGGENYNQPHEHRWVGDRCEICGATRRYRRAA